MTCLQLFSFPRAGSQASESWLGAFKRRTADLPCATHGKSTACDRLSLLSVARLPFRRSQRASAKVLGFASRPLDRFALSCSEATPACAGAELSERPHADGPRENYPPRWSESKHSQLFSPQATPKSSASAELMEWGRPRLRNMSELDTRRSTRCRGSPRWTSDLLTPTLRRLGPASPEVLRPVAALRRPACAQMGPAPSEDVPVVP